MKRGSLVSKGLASQLVVVLVSGAVMVGLSPQRAHGITTGPAKVVLTVVCLSANDVHDEPWGDSDFYANVAFANRPIVSMEDSADQDAFEDEDDICPNWPFDYRVADVAAGAFPITVEIRDEDEVLRGGDDLIDVDPGGDRTLNLTLDPVACAFSGEASGTCGEDVSVSGGSDDGARMTFRIEVEEPPAAPGLNVRCMHDKVWPLQSETVDITAEALDGQLQPVTADEIEIWVESRGGEASSTVGQRTLTYRAGPFTGLDKFRYGCRVRLGGAVAWTGWRQVPVMGSFFEGPLLPLLITGPRSGRIDVVLIPSTNSYTGPRDPNFLNDIGADTMNRSTGIILNDFYEKWQPVGPGNIPRFVGNLFLRNQDKFNFWLSIERGTAKDANGDDDHVAPSEWDDAMAFADIGLILHNDGNLRDFAPYGTRLISSFVQARRVALHELGHAPFGLSDEYCGPQANSAGERAAMPRAGAFGGCDGGYFTEHPDYEYPFPNLFDNLGDCMADAATFGTPPPLCQNFLDAHGDGPWAIHDPPSDDLMVDNQTPQNADIRRIETWILQSLCANSHC